MNEYYIVAVEYPAGLYFTGYDEKVEKVAKRLCDGGGMGMGYRDLSYYYKTKRGALNLYERLAKLKKLKRKVYSPDGNVVIGIV